MTVTAMPTTPTMTAARASDDIWSGLVLGVLATEGGMVGCCDIVGCETDGEDVEFSDGVGMMVRVGGIVYRLVQREGRGFVACEGALRFALSIAIP